MPSTKSFSVSDDVDYLNTQFMTYTLEDNDRCARANLDCVVTPKSEVVPVE